MDKMEVTMSLDDRQKKLADMAYKILDNWEGGFETRSEFLIGLTKLRQLNHLYKYYSLPFDEYKRALLNTMRVLQYKYGYDNFMERNRRKKGKRGLSLEIRKRLDKFLLDEGLGEREFLCLYGDELLFNDEAEDQLLLMLDEEYEILVREYNSSLIIKPEQLSQYNPVLWDQMVRDHEDSLLQDEWMKMDGELVCAESIRELLDEVCV